MKKCNIFFCFILFCCGCNPGINVPEKRNENWAWFVDAKTGEGTWVPVGNHSTALRNGDYTLFFCNGKIRQTGKLKNGKDCDTIFYYDINEKMISKVIMLPDSTLKEYMPDGKYKSYYSTCEIMAEGEIKNNKQVGARIEYHRNGKMKYKSVADADTSYEISYYDSGKIKDSVTIVNDLINGIATSWYENGRIETENEWKDGTETGMSVSYFQNGQINQKGRRYNGAADDTITDWYENGQMRARRYYVKGKEEGASMVWFENGKVNVSVSFIEDKKNGIYREYHQNGKLAKEGAYVQGKKTGIWKYFDESGKLSKSEEN